MTELVPIEPGSPYDTRPHPLRLTIEEFVMLDEAGAFANFSKAELIEGEVVLVNAQHRPHAFIKMELYDRIRDCLRATDSPFRALVEAAVAMPPRSLPEPDIVLTSEPIGEGFVPLSSVALAIEVADTSLKLDLGRKARMYARHKVQEYWVADVRGRAVHQMRLANGGRYEKLPPVPFGSQLKSATIPGLEIDTDFPI